MISLKNLTHLLLEDKEKIDKELLPEIKDLFDNRVLKPYFVSRGWHFDNNSSLTGLGEIDKGLKNVDCIKIIIYVEGKDVKEEKENFKDYINKTPDDIIGKYEGDIKFEDKPETISVMFIYGEDKKIEIKLIFSIDKKEKDFKEEFLNLTKVKQALLSGWARASALEMSEEDKKKMMKKADLEELKLEKDEEIDFKLDYKGFAIRKIKYDKKGELKEKRILYKTKSWKEFQRIFPFDTDKPFKNIVIDMRKYIKNDKSKDRIYREMKYVLVIKEKEKETKSGKIKEKALKTIRSQFGLSESIDMKNLVNGKNSEGETALYWALVSMNIELIETLMKKGADPFVEFQVYDGNYINAFDYVDDEIKYIKKHGDIKTNKEYDKLLYIKNLLKYGRHDNE